MSKTQALRIAVEGCGHGTLDAIYASVEKSCEIKRWDNVDLVIICGDFQAVRTQQDLNVTAMPQHYRRMGDFENYYYGSKVAPYLTVFIGGNHEASNHLFELHYGGWAAPNIYYLGAANVVRLGPIKIASTSGVYKGYDYRRPHYERLPYSSSDTRSIYHQRELDIRKLLSYTSQVDIGLSHDWPAGIEWLGNHKALFSRKGYLLPEARKGEMGSKPSAWVMDRLRPPYWFSAHHHFRYAAYKVHDEAQEDQSASDAADKTGAKSQDPKTRNEMPKGDAALYTKESESNSQFRSIDEGAVAAWKNFKLRVSQVDAADNAREEQAIQTRLEEQQRTGQPAVAAYQFEESFREVSVDDNSGIQRRQARSPEKQPAQQIPQLDGVGCSLPCLLPKRRRKSSPSDDTQPATRTRIGGQVNGSAGNATVNNPDAIDIDMSDSESEAGEQRPLITPTESIEEGVQEDTESELSVRKNTAAAEDSPIQMKRHDARSEEFRSFSRDSERLPAIKEVRSQESVRVVNPFIDGARSDEYLPSLQAEIINPTEDSEDIMKDIVDDTKDTTAVISDSADQNPGTNEESERRNVIVIQKEILPDADYEGVQLEFDVDISEDSESTDIPDDVRAQLAELSSNFAPDSKTTKSPDLPFPAEITNKATRFLALSKVEMHRPNDFLQLLEIEPYNSEDPAITESRSLPYELEYDLEWLAITRVFASELELSGSRKDRIPADRGETYYREKIAEEEKWVQKNIVEKGLLTIPQNFKVQTTQDSDLTTREEKARMPRELTNPQTSQFCELVGIDNPFDISEEERDARIEEGPMPDEWQEHGGGRGRARGGNRGNRGGRGRGRGRGGRGGRGRG